jgi:predicted PurR-regulated permease PerM
MAMDDAKPDNKLPNRRPLLIGVVVVLAVIVLIACIAALMAITPPGKSTSGINSACSNIQANLNKDRTRMQNLQAQLAHTTNPGQIKQQIAGVQQDLNFLQQQAKQNHCPP